MITDASVGYDSADFAQPQSELGAFLKTLRQRIPPQTPALGSWKRLPIRRGRRVSQEEIAEAVGVSRNWYRLLESGAKIRASMPLLDRLADALTFTSEERTRLFVLANPEMGAVRLGSDALTALEAFSWVRASVKRLWAATSETEAYDVATGAIAAWLKDATLVSWMRRQGAGIWESHCIANRGVSGIAEIKADVNISLSANETDEFMMYPRLHEAGATGTAEELPFKPRRARIEAYSRRALIAPDFIYARVRARCGRIGGLAVTLQGRPTPTERAVLGAVAELTSLALS